MFRSSAITLDNSGVTANHETHHPAMGSQTFSLVQFGKAVAVLVTWSTATRAVVRVSLKFENVVPGPWIPWYTVAKLFFYCCSDDQCQCVCTFFCCCFLSSNVLSSYCSRSQIRGHIAAGPSPPSPLRYNTPSFLSREEFSIFFPRRLASNCAYPRC